ncbi:MAG: virulence RhuM family protein [Synergistaceae bacterium]|nr:virulence RhuM family protein [Synergistaceae bacterium]
MKPRNYRFIVLSLLSALILLLNPLLCRASSGSAKPFDFSTTPIPPDYSNMSSWAADTTGITLLKRTRNIRYSEKVFYRQLFDLMAHSLITAEVIA